MSGLRERVEALAEMWEDEATDRGPEDRIYTAGAASMLRNILKIADEPTALAGYIVAPDARGEQAIWRTDDELFPTVAITQTWLDPALWDVLVNAIEGGQS